jgi:hypothetical protein
VCFRNGVPCSAKCRCSGCKNPHGCKPGAKVNPPPTTQSMVPVPVPSWTVPQAFDRTNPTTAAATATATDAAEKASPASSGVDVPARAETVVGGATAT